MEAAAASSGDVLSAASIRKRPNAEALLLGAGVALAVLVLLPGPYTPGSYGDDGTYLALGKALAGGAGYRSIHLVGAPYQVKFPPVYPALLSIFWQLGAGPYGVAALARIANAAFVGGAGALLWRLGRGSLAVSPVLLVAFVLGPLLLDANVHLYASRSSAEPPRGPRGGWRRTPTPRRSCSCRGRRACTS